MIGTRDFADLRPQIRRIYVTFLRIWGANFYILFHFLADLWPPSTPFTISQQAVTDTSKDTHARTTWLDPPALQHVRSIVFLNYLFRLV